MKQLPLRIESQQNPVADEVGALIAVTQPILRGILYAMKRDIVSDLGGCEGVTLKMLARNYRRGDGDCGICFEYAVHDALNRGESSVLERVDDALSRHCNVPGSVVSSILFGAEKSGSIELIETAKDLLTPDSRLRYGSKGQPAKLMKHIDAIAAAFRKREVRLTLPYSISGLWKADLFVGHSDSDRWVGTTVKVNRNLLEPARGMRIGIVPAHQGRNDKITKDDKRNLIVCPIPYDGAFMEIFYRGFGIVQQFIAADSMVPKEVSLPSASDRYVAKLLEDRRDFPVVDVINALAPLAQPGLLLTTERSADLYERRPGTSGIGAAIAPKAKVIQ